MESSRIRWAWLVLVVLLADQLSKFEIERLIRRDSTRVLVPGLLNFVHTNNTGVAFGLLADARSQWVGSVLVIFSAVVMLLLVWLLVAGRAGGPRGQAGMALILGGAAGNVLDRLVRHSVTDFIDFHILDHHWYTFNLADSAIVVGAALVLLELLRDWRHPGEEPV